MNSFSVTKAYGVLSVTFETLFLAAGVATADPIIPAGPNGPGGGNPTDPPPEGWCRESDRISMICVADSNGDDTEDHPCSDNPPSCTPSGSCNCETQYNVSEDIEYCTCMTGESVVVVN